MNAMQEQIERINEKLQVLLKKYQALQKENEKIKLDLDNRNGKEKEWREKTESLQQQVEILKASTGQMDDASKKEFEKRINQYLKEIDRCIALLGE
jgi:chromosome segregation ATPase